MSVLRSRSRSRDRDRERERERGGRPIGRRSRGGHSRSPPHVSVHNRLGALPSRGAGHPEVVRRDLGGRIMERRDPDRDTYLRDRERQVSGRGGGVVS